ncbi:hypothetical protein LTR05_001607 [Lithohypha guttulata]|uniref:GPR1/FUN34/YaaH-class plasma membrane protein n=1 Tax=Lithohypha guttulata TaxID=1690604 RepID=A0AAN7TER4_9EURO|nr:hypothetical protein LTR05_001607 [Lithohypha guttulata]
MTASNTAASTMFNQQDGLERGTMSSAETRIPPATFEQMYFAPKPELKRDLAERLGNPTGIAVAGFLLCTTPLSMQLLGWHGSDQLGLATVGAYFWIGGLLLLLGGIGDWILGNTFPATVFLTFSGFFFTFGATLLPSYNTYGAYGAEADNVAANWTSMRQFHSTFAFFLVSMTLLCTVYFIASIRTNVTFVLIFGFLTPTFSCLSASYFAYGSGNVHTGDRLQYAGAGLLFVISLIGWYEFLALMLLSVDFPYQLPLGDLSTKVKSFQEVQKIKKERKGE